MQTVIEVRDVVNRFGAQLVHDGVSFDVHHGEIFGITPPRKVTMPIN